MKASETASGRFESAAHIHAVVLGCDEFRRSWRAALADARVCSGACVQPGSPERADLVIASEQEAERAMRLAASHATAFVVAPTLGELLCGMLTFPGLQLLPPPIDDTARKRVAHWMVHCARMRVQRAAAKPIQLTASLRIDFDQGSVRITSMGRSTPLHYGEAALLRYLLGQRGVWVPTSQICNDVYNRTDVAACKLAWKYISTLRRKFGVHSKLLETHRSYGYRLSLPYDDQT